MLLLQLVFEEDYMKKGRVLDTMVGNRRGNNIYKSYLHAK